jgi:hypothetical protein
MTITSRLAKHVVQTAKYLHVMHECTQAKINALQESRPFYTLFEPAPDHPYDGLTVSAANLVQKYDDIVAALLDMEMGSGNLRFELDKIQAQSMYDEVELDADAERLRLLVGVDAATITAKHIADSALSLHHSCMWITDATTLKSLKYALELRHKKKYIKDHIEKPFLNITPDCRVALRSVKALCNVLMTLPVNGVRVGSQVDATNKPRFLKL